MSSSAHRWMLIDDFVNAINEHRASYFEPSDLICGDESMSKWNGLGGTWINIGLPVFVDMDRKPVKGCEIQNSACGKSGVMLRLRLVKSQEDNENLQQDDELNHGTNILLDLLRPWYNTDRVVCADSYFASVQTAEELLQHGLRFIGVVKTATRKYPMRFLSEFELQRHGDYKGVFMKDGNGSPSLFAFVWMDRDRRYFISSVSNLSPGTPYSRVRWRQVEDVETNNPPERVEFVIPQPKAAEMYYAACASIDRHNRCRQDSLQLERKIGTLNFDMRVNSTLLGMMIVDTWLVYSKATGTTELEKDFYTKLSEELIDNNYDTIGMRARRRNRGEETPAAIDRGLARAGLHAHLTPTKKKRKRRDGTITNYKLQGKCKICGEKTTFMCSLCVDARDESPLGSKTPWLCYTSKGKLCFQLHIDSHHQLEG